MPIDKKTMNKHMVSPSSQREGRLSSCVLNVGSSKSIGAVDSWAAGGAATEQKAHSPPETGKNMKGP